MSSKYLLYLATLAGCFCECNSSAQLVPPSITVQAQTVSSSPAGAPWALTIQPAPINGTNGQNVTNVGSIGFGWTEENYENANSSPDGSHVPPNEAPKFGTVFKSAGNVQLRAGLLYTFYLSNTYGGGWRTDNFPYSFVGLSFLGYNGTSFVGSPQWNSYKVGPFTGSVLGYGYEYDALPTYSFASMYAAQISFQIPPQISTNIEDGSYTPPITSYVPSGTIFTRGQPLMLGTDVYVWTLPNTPISLISNRAYDTFKLPNGSADNSGVFYSMLNNKDKVNAATVRATLVDKTGHFVFASSALLSPLPAKFRMTYRCTAYYTPKESGFTAAGGFNMTPKTAPGIGNMTFPHSFVSAAKQEGYGKVTAAHARNGMRYIAYDSNAGTYSFVSAPVGSTGTALVARSSCAVLQTSSATIPNTARVTTEATKINAAFGNQNFVVADRGGLEPDQIDLYWGEDDPTPSQIGSPAGTSYQPNEGTPVVLTNY